MNNNPNGYSNQPMNNYPNNGYNNMQYQNNINYNNQQYNNQPMNNFNPNVVTQPKKKKKHGFLKFLLVVILLFVGFRTYKYFANKIKQDKFAKQFHESYLMMQDEEEGEIPEETLNSDINNEGLTFKQKLDMGLNPFNTDNDGDGISDADEINTYHSDPLKYSTSEDLLSDAYKVKHNLDINKKYNELPEIKIGNDKIKLTAKRAEDIEAVYKDYNGAIPVDYYLGMKPFKIFSFTGKADIEIENAENFEVYSYDVLNNKTSKIKSTAKSNTLSFDVKNDDPILVAYKDKVVDDMIRSQTSFIDYGNSQNYECIVLAFPFMSALFNKPVQIYLVTSSPNREYEAKKFEQELFDKYGPEYPMTVSTIHPAGAKIVDSIFEKLLGDIRSYTSEGILSHLVVYKHFNAQSDLIAYLGSNEKTPEDETIEEDDEQEEVQQELQRKWLNTNCEYCADSGFDMKRNSWRVDNLSTTVSRHGACLGMANIITRIFNDDPIDRKIDGEYDLTGSEYDMIFDKRFYDYIPKSEELATYADEISHNEPILKSKKMAKPDSEVVKAMEYYYSTGNKRFNELGYRSMYKRRWLYEKIQTTISSSQVDELLYYFKHGKVVTGVLMSKDKFSSEHAVNLYKITEDVNDPDILYIRVYDNNLPNDQNFYVNEELVDLDLYIKLKRCYKYNPLFEEDEAYYLFYYNPANPIAIQDDFGNLNGETDALFFFGEDGFMFH